MKLDRTLEKHYPNLSRWIRREIPLCRKNERIFDAFVKYSQLSEQAAETALADNGLAPTIDVGVMLVYGKYKPFKHPDKIFLQRHLCRAFDKLDPDKAFGRNYDMVLKATILHEMIHWADHVTDGARQAGGFVYDDVKQERSFRDVGFLFENEAFHGIYTTSYLIK